MKGKGFRIATFVSILILLMLAPGLAQGPVGPQGSTDVLGFQGHLGDAAGNPLNGSYDLRFSIYDAETGGTAVWGPETHEGVSVSDGLFAVSLGSEEPLDAEVFDGGGRWLEVEVWNGEAWETLSPRLLIGSAAYAFSAGGLTPGTTISGSGPDSILSVINTGGGGARRSVEGATWTVTDMGMLGMKLGGRGDFWGGVGGISSIPSGRTYGVYGETRSSTDGASGVYGRPTVLGETWSLWMGAGVYGLASSTSGRVYGVYGHGGTGYPGVRGYYLGSGEGCGVSGMTKSSTDDAAGVYGEAEGDVAGVLGSIMSSSEGAAGVYGLAAADQGVVYGVLGEVEGDKDDAAGVASQVDPDGKAYGVYGRTESSTDDAAGVYGSAGAEEGTVYGIYAKSSSGTGVYGLAGAAGGKTYGVYGEVRSTTDEAAGVYGLAVVTDTTNPTYGVYGQTDSASDHARGVYGYAQADAGEGQTYGVFGQTDSSGDDAAGVYGYADSDFLEGKTYGVFGQTNSSDTGAAGAHGWADASHGETYGVHGVAKSEDSEAAAVYGRATAGAGGGRFESQNGIGLLVKSASSTLLVGYNDSQLVFEVDGEGYVYADGGYMSPAADFAEMLPAVEGLEPGDVLAVGLDGRVIPADAEHATAIVGVYSTQPAFLGEGEAATHQVPVAIVGVVPVKVTTENGPIRPDDPLTVSPTHPGYAVKAIPILKLSNGGDIYAGGTILGRALEGLDRGEGLILVLLQLQ